MLQGGKTKHVYIMASAFFQCHNKSYLEEIAIWNFVFVLCILKTFPMILVGHRIRRETMWVFQKGNPKILYCGNLKKEKGWKEKRSRVNLCEATSCFYAAEVRESANNLWVNHQFPSPVKWLKCKRVHSRDDSSRIIDNLNNKQIAVLGETIEEVLFFLVTSAVLCKNIESEVRQISSFVHSKFRNEFSHEHPRTFVEWHEISRRSLRNFGLTLEVLEKGQWMLSFIFW